MARVACECVTTTGMILVMGEITTNSYVSIDKIARQKVLEIGYDRAKYGFDGNSCAVLVSVDEQSPDIAMGVDNALEGRAEQIFDIGAGDQGMMFGYASDETRSTCLAIALAHRLTGSWLGAQDGRSPTAPGQTGDGGIRTALPAAGSHRGGLTRTRVSIQSGRRTGQGVRGRSGKVAGR